jgi:hypothetical protein
MSEKIIYKREKYPTRTIALRTRDIVDRAIAMLNSIPIDPDKPIELIVREQVKARKPDQNALMWRGPLKDIAEQAYVVGRSYSAEVWHEHFKRQYLPEVYDDLLCKSESYRKWDITPGGERVLVGSTTELTIHGFALYLTAIEADGANMGVMFHANPRDTAPEWLR